MKTIAHLTQNSLQTSRTRRILLASIASLLAGHAGFAAEAIFSSGAITGDTGTSATGAGATGSGVSGTKTYTAIANVIGADVLVNGATFVGSVDALSGVGWELTGLPNNFASGGNHTTTFGGNAGGAAIDQLFDGFQYGGDPGTLTLSGLTAGKTYVTTLYNEAWSWPSVDDRTNAFTSSQGVSTLYNPDALEASVLRYTFVATGATETLNFAQTRSNYSLHVYGLSNEQVFVNTWSPGGANNFTTATNWSGGVVPAAAAGSSASFSAQAGPTTVNLPANRTVGHIEILGTGSYTLTHDPEDEPSIRLQADAGGVSVLKTETGGSHTIDVGVVLVSDAMKVVVGRRAAGRLAQEQPRHGLRHLLAGLAIAGMQFGQRAMQQFLGQALGQRFEHAVDVVALGQQLAGTGDLGGAPVVGLCVQRLDQRHGGALVEPVAEALHTGVDDGLGLGHRGLPLFTG